MRKEIGASLMAAGLSFGLVSCGDSIDTPQEVITRHQQILDDFKCNVDSAPISVKDLSEESQQVFGDPNMAKAVTGAEGIQLDDSLSTKRMTELVIHETLHWCADREKSTEYEKALLIPRVGSLTGAEGFVPHIDHNPEGPTHIEEGVVEWVSLQEEDYTPHENYAELAQLTSLIADLRNFTAQEVVDLLKNDDLVGYVARVTDKLPQEVSGEDVDLVVSLYMEVDNRKDVPTKKDLKIILG